MNELRSMAEAQDSTDIVVGYINKGSKRKTYDEYKADQEETYIKKCGTCKANKMSKEDIEKMLADQFGDKLKPIKHNVTPPPKSTDLSEPVVKPKKEKLERAKLEPRHLTAERLRRLVIEGKTAEDVMRLYNFNSRNYLREVVNRLGCRGIFKRAKSIG